MDYIYLGLYKIEHYETENAEEMHHYAIILTLFKHSKRPIYNRNKPRI